MFTRILHNSAQLCTFLDQLGLDLHQPQRRHILNLADALLVCEDCKTLAALRRQFVTAPDASNMADFLRISPWRATDVRAALRRGQVAWLLGEAARRGLPQGTLHQPGRLAGREAQGHPASGAGRLALRSYREHAPDAALQERHLLPGLHAPSRRLGGDGGSTVVPARTHCAATQSPPPAQPTPPLRQQVPLGAADTGRTAAAVTHGLADLSAVRQLVCVRTTPQVCSPPRLACHLWPEVQSYARWVAPRPTGDPSQAQALHARACHRCGWEEQHLLCAPDDWPLSRSSRHRPRLLLETAPPGQVPGVLHVYGHSPARRNKPCRVTGAAGRAR